jgi:aryl-alcohol dehydrogenase-like predicted oxidoreductase
MKIALGTVQFGLNYGVTNSEGQVSLDEVGSMLELAKQGGVSVIDTAIAYGDSETTLGQFDLSPFSVVSKIPSRKNYSESIEKSVSESLKRLNIDSLYGVMLHDEGDVFSENNKLLNELRSLQEQGLIQRVGASFYSPEIAFKAIDEGIVDIIQVPGNQLDSRFCQYGVFDKAVSKNVEVHVRSLFLQGLLAINDHKRPISFQKHPDLIKYDKYAKESGLSNLELALLYLEQTEDIDIGVLGFVNAQQLKETLIAYKAIRKKKTELRPTLSSCDDILLNPSKW